MKKIFILVISLFLIPFVVKAETKVESLNDVVVAEGFTLNDSEYQETDDQVTIYLFRGQGCHNCTNFINYLNSLLPEYGKYFKLRAYEVWYNEDNGKLMEEVSTYFNDNAEGIPYIILGEKTYIGFNEELASEEFEKLIVDEFNKEKRFDVMENLNAKESNNSLMGLIVGLVVISIISFIVIARKSESIKNTTDKKNLED